jgi:hypothetical protein
MRVLCQYDPFAKAPARRPNSGTAAVLRLARQEAGWMQALIDGKAGGDLVPETLILEELER